MMRTLIVFFFACLELMEFTFAGDQFKNCENYHIEELHLRALGKISSAINFINAHNNEVLKKSMITYFKIDLASESKKYAKDVLLNIYPLELGFQGSR